MRFLSGFFRYAGAVVAALGLAPIIMYCLISNLSSDGVIKMNMNWFQIIGTLGAGVVMFVIGEVMRKRNQQVLGQLG